MKIVCFALLSLPLLACASDPSALASPTRADGGGAVTISPSPTAAPATVTTSGDAPPHAPPALAPLSNHEWLEAISAPRDEVAKLSVPNGATNPRPIMVGLHGGGDRAEWSCGEWRGVTAAYPFIVCPHGGPTRTYWDTPKNVMSQIDGARAEVNRSFAGYVADGPMVLAGFSAGTMMALTLLQGGLVAPEALVLVEGSYDSVGDKGFPAMLKAHHVKRLLLVCTTRGSCTSTYREALPRIARMGIDVRLNLASEQGHGFYEEVTFSLRRDWPWLVRGLQGWDGYVADGSPDLPGKTITP
jgi:poly(3-hydroxybutyrate) depolymerase